MDFQLTEEQTLIRDMVRSYVEAGSSPGVKARHETERFDRTLMFDKLAKRVVAV